MTFLWSYSHIIGLVTVKTILPAIPEEAWRAAVGQLMQSYRGQSWPASSGDGAEGGGVEGQAEKGMPQAIHRLRKMESEGWDYSSESSAHAWYVTEAASAHHSWTHFMEILPCEWGAAASAVVPPASFFIYCVLSEKGVNLKPIHLPTPARRVSTRQGLWTPVIFTQVSWKDACDLVLIINKSVSD